MQPALSAQMELGRSFLFPEPHLSHLWVSGCPGVGSPQPTSPSAPGCPPQPAFGSDGVTWLPRLLGASDHSWAIKMHSCPSRKKHPGILEICPENGDLELSGLHLRGDGGPSAGLGKRSFRRSKLSCRQGFGARIQHNRAFFLGGGGGGGGGGLACWDLSASLGTRLRSQLSQIRLGGI